MRKMTCLVCPVSCQLEIQEEAGQVRVEGNRCPRGLDFAQREVTRPMRTLSSTVRSDSPDLPLLPVKLSGPVPKDRLMDVMDQIRPLRVSGPIRQGQVLLADVLGLGVDLVATCDLAKEVVKGESQP